MTRARRRSSAPVSFQGQEVRHDMLVQLWNQATQTQSGSRRHSRYRVNTARGLRLKTMVVELEASWKRMHPTASEWVVKVLPERRTLERDLIANVGAIEPTYSRVAVPTGSSGGLLDRDDANASACENYMETWRQQAVPYQTSIEKCSEDGEHGGTVYPADVDMDGCPDFYDYLEDVAYDELGDEERAGYEKDENDRRGRYVGKNPDGSKRTNPAYDRDKQGQPRGDRKDFTRDDDKSKEAHERAVTQYLLRSEHDAIAVRIIPANDCVPFLVRGRGRDRWEPIALLERTLYYPVELQRTYGWQGMGDRALIPVGFDPLRETGQNGMFYVYTLHTTWIDPDDPKKIERPIICYSVGGHPTWMQGDPPEGDDLPECGVAVLDLYESHGLTGRYFWYGGGLHTSDDDSDFYWEPYLWPLTETILGIEGMQTSINGATAVQAFTGYFHKPDAAVMAELREVDDDSILEQDGELRRPKIPMAGEIATSIGEVTPAQQATVSPDAWRVVQTEYQSLRENTALEQPGSSASASGHQMVVKETIAVTAKRHIREGALDFVKFCGERAMRIFEAIDKAYDVRWPLQTTKERPIGDTVREAYDPLVWDSAWVGDGEYKLATTYPEEYNPVKVETAINAMAAGVGTDEDVWTAMGVTDFATQRAKILKMRIRNSPEYIQARSLQVAKQSGDKLMLKVLKLQQDQRMTKGGPPGFDSGMPTAALRGPGEGAPGGPSTAQRSLGGQMASQVAPAMRDAEATAQVPGAA